MSWLMSSMSQSRKHHIMAPSSAMLLPGAILSTLAAVFLDELLLVPEFLGAECLPLVSPLRVRVAFVGQNESSAQHVTLQVQLLPWRPRLAAELLPLLSDGAAATTASAWDREGNPLFCASSALWDAIIYVAPKWQQWQWSSEWVGKTRHLRLPPDIELRRHVTPADEAAFDEAGVEVDPSAVDVSEGLQPSLVTLSTDPPLFRVRGLVS
jgi:hypothetical protein